MSGEEVYIEEPSMKIICGVSCSKAFRINLKINIRQLKSDSYFGGPHLHKTPILITFIQGRNHIPFVWDCKYPECLADFVDYYEI